MKKRILAMFIDYLIVLLISLIPLFVYAMVNDFNVFEAVNSIISFSMFLLILKDLLYKNASIGKKIMKIEIRKKDNEFPSITTVILRNITVIIWPLECLLILLKKDRIGDIICDTKVIEVNNWVVIKTVKEYLYSNDLI